MKLLLDEQMPSGVWVFTGSRVPVKALFDNLEDGATVDEFLEWFPGVTKAQVQAAIRHKYMAQLLI